MDHYMMQRSTIPTLTCPHSPSRGLLAWPGVEAEQWESWAWSKHHEAGAPTRAVGMVSPGMARQHVLLNTLQVSAACVAPSTRCLERRGTTLAGGRIIE